MDLIGITTEQINFQPGIIELASLPFSTEWEEEKTATDKWWQVNAPRFYGEKWENKGSGSGAKSPLSRVWGGETSRRRKQRKGGDLARSRWELMNDWKLNKDEPMDGTFLAILEKKQDLVFTHRQLASSVYLCQRRSKNTFFGASMMDFDVQV